MQFLLITAWLAAVVYATIPPFWLLIHPFAEFWRKRKRSPFRILLPLWVLMWIAAAAITWPWHAVRLYTTPFVWIATAILSLCSISVYRRIGSEFGRKNVSGESELRPKEYEQKLVTTGLHARVRHPIYLAHLCMLLGWTVGSGLLVTYVLLAFAVVSGTVMIRLEEQELQKRFGDQFDAYCEAVPAILPWTSKMKKLNVPGR